MGNAVEYSRPKNRSARTDRRYFQLGRRPEISSIHERKASAPETIVPNNAEQFQYEEAYPGWCMRDNARKMGKMADV